VDDLLDAKQVKKLLRVSLPLVYKMAERGQLPCIRWECPGEWRQEKDRGEVRAGGSQGFH
jgi:hypothetical protein